MLCLLSREKRSSHATLSIWRDSSRSHSRSGLVVPASSAAALALAAASSSAAELFCELFLPMPRAQASRLLALSAQLKWVA